MYVLVFWNVTSCSLVYADDNVRHYYISQAVTVSKPPADINRLMNMDCGIEGQYYLNKVKCQLNATR